MVAPILEKFGLNVEACTVQQLHSGLINKTWKVTTGGRSFILQRINHHVFKNPGYIDNNLVVLKKYLNRHSPEYLFVAPVAAPDGASLVHTADGYFRLFDFVEGSETINTVQSAEQAYEAARHFGKFARLLSGFNANDLKYTLPDFHNLTLRYDQFTESLAYASVERLEKASEAIRFIRSNEEIVKTYNAIVSDPSIPHRVVHHDTKISNILFDHEARGLCVVDLDTVMPGYYISDVGDMMRTYLSPANEEETDLGRIAIRRDFFQAIYHGYLSEMGNTLTEPEKQLFIYSGKFLIYMQAIRFLTDYLNDDIYYGASYPGHNLNRAINQVTLLEKYMEAEPDFKVIVSQLQPNA